VRPGGSLRLASPTWAQRAPVLQPVKVRHPHYFREMFIPQVSSGPGSVAWSPDGSELVHAEAEFERRQAPE
jgi:TolB protein